MSREELGLPKRWEVVEKWARKAFKFGPPLQNKPASKPLKYGDLDFTKEAGEDFWKQFPSRPLPQKPTTRVDIDMLKKELRGVEKKFTIHEISASKTTLENLTTGAPSHQRSQLPGCLLKNASSSTKHGPVFTETLEKWLVEDIVAGPFSTPPLPNFRSNSIMAVEQKDKVRPILNMSYPKVGGFNDNIDEDKVAKVRMSSARQFGQSIRMAGRGARMSKLDMRDAYKHVPAKVEDYRLQGMCWLKRFFVDTQQIFGASTAVANFDNLASTVLNIVLCESSIPRHLVHRTLDDVACVSPADTTWGADMAARYKSLCEKVNIKLAADCPLREKAFTEETKGTVLGIQFNTATLSWRISSQKAAEILSDIHTMIHGGHVDLKQMETVAGRLNNFGQMCPFLQAFKRPLNNLLAEFREDYSILLPVSCELVEDLRVWAAVISHANGWLPIPKEMQNPPLCALEFVSDAAGGTGEEEWAGVASLGLTSSGGFWFLCKGSWPSAILNGQDEKGASFASKTTTLEMVGLLLPFLTVPNVVKGRNIILGVDNISVVFGWENRSVCGDLTASALIRALHLLACFLECRIFARHVPRQSCLASVMADSLTRASTAKEEVWAEVTGAAQFDPPEPLWEWLENPQTDWMLGFKLIDWLKQKM